MPLIDGKFEPLQLPEKHAKVLLDPGKQCHDCKGSGCPKCKDLGYIPWRYRVLWGGRSGAKDWSKASVAIERGVRKSTRFLCTREVQDSIKESIHQLLSDTISRLGYNDYYRVLKNEIVCLRNDTTFTFKGLKDLTVENLKSFEGIDVCMIGEARNLSKNSFMVLDPTIRKEFSEIWIDFNPKFDDDFIYDFCVLNPPSDLIGCEVSYLDNPWTNELIHRQANRMKATDPVMYEHIWLGKTIGQGGRVYPMYTPSIHEIDFDLEYLKICNLYMAIDPHRKYYPAIKWYAVTPTNAIIVYNEWPRYEDLNMFYDEARNSITFDLPIKDLANRILANDLTLSFGGKVTRVGDPRFLAEHTDFIKSLVEYGVSGWVDAPYEKIETQRDNLKNMMSYNPALPIEGINAPDWYVRKGLRNTSRSYVRHCYDEKRDKESEENKDFIDCDRYFLSILDGKPSHVPVNLSKKKNFANKLISLAQHHLNTLPAHSYKLGPQKARK